MGQQQPTVPQAPNPAQTYQQGLQTYLKYQPRILQQEMGARAQYDPQRLAEQQALQAIFGPTQYGEQLQALNQLNPLGVSARDLLGAEVLGNFPESQGLYNALRSTLGNQSQNTLANQNQLANYLRGQYQNTGQQMGGLQNFLSNQMGTSNDQLRQYQALMGINAGNSLANQNQLGQSLQQQLNAGTQLTPAEQNQAQQQVRAAQAARGNDLGNASSFEEALTLGQRGQQLYQQRVQNMQNFLGQGNAAAGQLGQSLEAQNPYAAQYAQSLATPNPYTGQFAQVGMGANPGLQSYEGFLQSPNQNYAQLGSFLSSPTPEQEIQGIQPISPDRSNQYINPNAGFLGQQVGQANYANQLAQYQAQLSQPNPWAGALGGAASGALAGSSFGPYGAAIGGTLGGLGGYFGYSDERLKKNIEWTGENTRDGIPIVTFNWIKEGLGKWKGVISQWVKKVRPDAVFQYHGYDMVDYEALGVRCERVS